MKAVTINGTSYNLAAAAGLSLEDFKKEGKESFAKDVSDKTLGEIHAQLTEAHASATDDEKAEQKTAKTATAALKSGLPVIIEDADTDAELRANTINEAVDVNTKSPAAAADKSAGKGK